MKKIVLALSVLLSSLSLVSCDRNEATSVSKSVFYVHPNDEDTAKAKEKLAGTWVRENGQKFLTFSEEGNVVFENGQEIATFGYAGVTYNQIRITYVSVENNYLVKQVDYTYIPVGSNKLYFNGFILRRM